MAKRTPLWTAYAAAALYAVSFALPTAGPFNSNYSSTVYSGADAFEMTGNALLEFDRRSSVWWIIAAWMVNPLIVVAIIATFAARERCRRLAAGLAVVLALTVLIWCGPIVAFLPGYWVWVGSAALLFFAGNLSPVYRSLRLTREGEPAAEVMQAGAPHERD